MKTIAPPVCLNCEHLAYVESRNADMPITGRCAWGPMHVSVVDARVFSCGQRKPLDEPRFVVPTEEVEADAEELGDADA